MNSTDDFTDTSTTTSSKPWADILLACLAINVVTLSGVLLTAFTRLCVAKSSTKTLIEALMVPSFAAGALLATAAFLLIPEALELLLEAQPHEDHRLLQDTHDDHDSHQGEAAFAWKFGTALLGGFVLPLVLHTLLPQAQAVIDDCEACQQQESELLSPAAARELVEQDEEETKDEQVEEKPFTTITAGPTTTEDLATMESGCDAKECQHEHHIAEHQDAAVTRTNNAPLPSRQQHTPINLPLTLSILLGDAIHNFTDGVFLANAFLLCSRDIAWTLVATTIYHELAQELADFVVLTTQCGLPVYKALALNFVCGFSVLLGAVVILLADLSSAATGVILAVSAGVYLYITAVECVPRVLEFTKGQRKLFGIFLSMFALGAVPIGLVLLNHGHCGSE